MKKKIVLGLSIVVLIVVAFFFIQEQTLQIDVKQLKEFIKSFGVLAPIVFIVLNVVTIVFSPLTSFSFWLASLALFGYWPICFYHFSRNLGLFFGDCLSPICL